MRGSSKEGRETISRSNQLAMNSNSSRLSALFFPLVVAGGALFGSVIPIAAGESKTVVLEPADERSEAPSDASRGFEWEVVATPPPKSIEWAKENTGVILQSFKPGMIWKGARPEFVPSEIDLGGEGMLPCTAVYEDGPFLHAHYGRDHYQTRAVVVIDENRRERIRFIAGSHADLSRLHYDPEAGVVYYTTLEGNLGGEEKGRARLHAWSVSEGRPLWSTDPATAHGDFLVLERHILAHYGFTDEKDYLRVFDRGSGRLVLHYLLPTAAEATVSEGGGMVLVPCYEGGVRVIFYED